MVGRAPEYKLLAKFLKSPVMSAFSRPLSNQNTYAEVRLGMENTICGRGFVIRLLLTSTLSRCVMVATSTGKVPAIDFPDSDLHQN